jgi:hypothetical protein
MKEFILTAPIKLLSINAAFVVLKNGRRIRSKAYVAFAKEISLLMRTRRIDFEAWEKNFNPKFHEIHAILIYGTPELLTKDGRISQKSVDIANCEKCLIDNVLIKTIDDSQITQWRMKKIYSEKFSFYLRFEIKDRSI